MGVGAPPDWKFVLQEASGGWGHVPLPGEYSLWIRADSSTPPDEEIWGSLVALQEWGPGRDLRVAFHRSTMADYEQQHVEIFRELLPQVPILSTCYMREKKRVWVALSNLLVASAGGNATVGHGEALAAAIRMSPERNKCSAISHRISQLFLPLDIDLQALGELSREAFDSYVDEMQEERTGDRIYEQRVVELQKLVNGRAFCRGARLDVASGQSLGEGSLRDLVETRTNVSSAVWTELLSACGLGPDGEKPSKTELVPPKVLYELDEAFAGATPRSAVWALASDGSKLNELRTWREEVERLVDALRDEIGL